MNYKITRAGKPPAEEMKVLTEGLNDHGSAIVGPTKYEDVSFLIRDEKGRIVGGVFGNYGSFGWMYVDTLWVSAELRGTGLGKRLMDLIEAEAIEAGCTDAYLNTFSFQAPEFYIHRGYKVFGELKDFPPDYSRLFLRKRLTAASRDTV